ncbi:MAG: hypothetical protein L0H96_18340 [Humibacillus sp.]|nr:hypothetical protein [Humibacillus sp.]MDN5778858.1 hypothetical protein [Humibacillus sp.]
MRSGDIEPLNLPDALAIAFTGACLDAIDQPEMLALEAGEHTGGHTRAAYVLLAKSLGMGRERFRLNMQGARWITLPEIAVALADPLVGPHLGRRLAPFLADARVLHKDRDAGGTSVSSRGEAKVGSTAGHRTSQDMTVSDSIEIREARVCADVVALDRAQQRDAQRGLNSTGPDWSAVRRMLGDPRPAATSSPSTAASVRAAGVPSLAAMLRAILRDEPNGASSYRIKQKVQAQAPKIRPDQVDTALARLADRGEARRVRQGFYVATDLMKGASQNT